MTYFICQFDYLNVGNGLKKPNISSICRIMCTVDLDSCPVTFEANKLSSLFDCDIGDVCDIELGFGKGELSDIIHSCVEDMKMGDERKYTVTITKDLDDIKLGTEFQFDIKLLSFSHVNHLYCLSPESKLNNAIKFKTLGNKLFASNKLFSASVCYSHAIQFLVSINSSENCKISKNNEFKAAFVSCKLNLSACQLKRKLYSETIQNCSDVLLLDSSSCKALYRRGCAYLALNDYEKLEHDILHGLQLQPGNTSLQRLNINYHQKKKKVDAQLSKRLKSMFM